MPEQATPKAVRPGFLSWTAAVLVCLLLGNHLLMTASYLSPPNLLRLDLQDYSNKYMPRFFSQNWHLFSPNPGITYTKIAVRSHSQASDWGPWVDPTENLYGDYYHNRLSGYFKLMLIYRKVATDLDDAYNAEELELKRANGCHLDLMSVQSESEIPTNGNDLVIVAKLDGNLRFRLFMKNLMLIDYSEKNSADDPNLVALSDAIESVRNGKSLSKAEQDKALSAVTANLGGHIPEVMTRLSEYDRAYKFARRSCTAGAPGSVPTEIQWKILVFYPVKFSESQDSQKRWSHVIERVFPPVPYDADPSPK